MGENFKILPIACLCVWSVFCAEAYAQNQTLGPGSCGLAQNNCHVNENTWWKDDAHKVTVDAFFDDPESYEKIAKLAGVDPAGMLKGNNQCMSCHGTVISGKEAREVEDGVSCESCHGPGSGYKDPHSEGDPNLGLDRPGYVKALQLGLVENKNVSTRGQTCVRCHYITDQKLLSAGHPDGARFNYISGIKKVAKHWQRTPADADLSKAPFEAAMAAQGPIAAITKAEPAPTPVAAPPQPESQPQPLVDSQPAASSTTATPSPAAQTPPPPAPQAVAPALATPTPQTMRPTPSPMTRMRAPLPAPSPEPESSPLPAENLMPLFLPPFPAVSDTMPLQEILVILKKRLELLYQRTGGN